MLAKVSSGTELAQAMSHLAYGDGLQKMTVVDANKTVYLDGAMVPRARRLESGGTLRAFTSLEVLEGREDKIAETCVRQLTFFNSSVSCCLIVI
ncbi:hypothetical protein NC651_038940 [Populus alba x Populus x berolinensis]|nr:hypothetical protein NC651_038940 [Populus alba x Populus x berolinensis]